VMAADGSPVALQIDMRKQRSEARRQRKPRQQAAESAEETPPAPPEQEVEHASSRQHGRAEDIEHVTSFREEREVEVEHAASMRTEHDAFDWSEDDLEPFSPSNRDLEGDPDDVER